jgi:hypothetical protein
MGISKPELMRQAAHIPVTKTALAASPTAADPAAT